MGMKEWVIDEKGLTWEKNHEREMKRETHLLQVVEDELSTSIEIFSKQRLIKLNYLMRTQVMWGTDSLINWSLTQGW